MSLEPTLVEWLTRRDHSPVREWAPDPPRGEVHCHPDLIARLSEVAKPIQGAARVFVAGCPVVHHPWGAPIAAASGRAVLLVRSAQAAGALVPSSEVEDLFDLGFDPSWVQLDPWAVDMSFVHTIYLLRGHVSRAFALAEEAAWR